MRIVILCVFRFMPHHGSCVTVDCNPLVSRSSETLGSMSAAIPCHEDSAFLLVHVGRPDCGARLTQEASPHILREGAGCGGQRQAECNPWLLAHHGSSGGEPAETFVLPEVTHLSLYRCSFFNVHGSTVGPSLPSSMSCECLL